MPDLRTEPHVDTLGLVEAKGITQGVRMTDAMLKAASVELIKATPICSGRYMIQVSGLQADVQEAIAAAELCDPGPLDTRLLSRISPQVMMALKRQTPLPANQAVGLVESRRAVSGIAAADAAVKKADVILARLAVANGINGKSYLVLGGNVAAVTEAVDAACDVLKTAVLDRLVLPNPDPETVRALCPLAPADQ